jgi:hypothetical protein
MPESGYTTRSALVSRVPVPRVEAVVTAALRAVLLVVFVADVPLAGMMSVVAHSTAPTV